MLRIVSEYLRPTTTRLSRKALLAVLTCGFVLGTTTLSAQPAFAAVPAEQSGDKPSITDIISGNGSSKDQPDSDSTASAQPKAAPEDATADENPKEPTETPSADGDTTDNGQSAPTVPSPSGPTAPGTPAPDDGGEADGGEAPDAGTGDTDSDSDNNTDDDVTPPASGGTTVPPTTDKPEKPAPAPSKPATPATPPADTGGRGSVGDKPAPTSPTRPTPVIPTQQKPAPAPAAPTVRPTPPPVIPEPRAANQPAAVPEPGGVVNQLMNNQPEYTFIPQAPEPVVTESGTPNTIGSVNPITYRTSALDPAQTRSGYTTALVSLTAGIILVLSTQSRLINRRSGAGSRDNLQNSPLQQIS